MKAIISIATVLILSAFTLAPNQGRLILGVVSDQTGHPMAGVTVTVKGTNIGAVTDMNGAYQITAETKANYLVFSFIGYEIKEVKIKDSNRIDVTLKISVIELKEVVSVEYDAIQTYDMQVSHVSNPMVGTLGGVAVNGGNRHYAKKSHHTSSYVREAMYLPHNTEGYSAIDENGFKDVTYNPLSTLLASMWTRPPIPTCEGF